MYTFAFIVTFSKTFPPDKTITLASMILSSTVSLLEYISPTALSIIVTASARVINSSGLNVVSS